MTTDNSEKMLKRLKLIWNETVSVFHHLNLFKFTDGLFEKNKRLREKDSTYFDWIMQSSTVDLIIRTARLCDDRTDTESLTRFLRKLKKDTYLLSRERYKNLYKKDPMDLKDLADHYFDKLAGKNESHYPEKLIDADIKTLTQDNPCRRIIDYRNEYIAHLAKEKGPASTYNELFESLTILSNLENKYEMLLKASSSMSHTPTIQGNWREVLTIPWLSK